MTKREFVERTAPLVLTASWAGHVFVGDDGDTAVKRVVQFAIELWDEIEKQVPADPPQLALDAARAPVTQR